MAQRRRALGAARATTSDGRSCACGLSRHDLGRPWQGMHRRTLVADAQPDRARIGDPWRPGVHERACEDVDLRLARTGIGYRASCVGHKSPWAHGWPRRGTSPRVPAHRGTSRQVHAVTPRRTRSWPREITISVRLVTTRDRQVSRPGAMVSARNGGRPGLPTSGRAAPMVDADDVLRCAPCGNDLRAWAALGRYLGQQQDRPRRAAVPGGPAQ